MDVALIGLKVWRVQARTVALATMEMTEIAHEMMRSGKHLSNDGTKTEQDGARSG